MLKTFILICLFGFSLFGFEDVKYYDTSLIKEKNFPRSSDNFGVIKSDKGNYQIFVSKKGIVLDGEKKEVFFGEVSDYYKKNAEDNKKLQLKEGGLAGAANALQANSSLFVNGGSEILKAGVSGFGIGAIYAVITPIVENYLTDKQYISVTVFYKNNKEIGRVSSIFISDDDEFSEKEIKQLIKEKEIEKGVKND